MSAVNVVTYHEELLADRQQAAEMLLVQLSDYVEASNPVILGIPRGGVVLARIMAKHLHARMDIVLTGKITAPHNPEFAIGAVSENGNLYTDDEYIAALGVSKSYIEQEKQRQLEEIRRRKELYRQVRQKVALKDQTVVLTDDGAATGATMQAAIWACEREKPEKIILALPVAPPQTLRKLSPEVSEIVCLCAANNFQSISQFYTNFEPVDDETVIALLKETTNQPQ